MNLTLDEVAFSTGFSKPYLSTIETGRVNNPPRDRLLDKLETVLEFEKGLLRYIAHVEAMPADVREDYEARGAEIRKFKEIIRNLIAHKTDTYELGNMISNDELNIDRPAAKITAGILVPIINKVTSGYPTDADDLGYPVGSVDDYVRCPDVHDPNAFAIRIIGDSMEDKFHEGDIVIFSPVAKVRSGNDCFVRFASPHENTFKRVYFEGGDTVRLQPRNQKYPPMMTERNRIDGLYRATIKYEIL
jgi:SOS-response transcriptional repressor LexA